MYNIFGSKKLLKALKWEESSTNNEPDLYTTYFEYVGRTFLIVMDSKSFYSVVYLFDNEKEMRDQFEGIFNSEVECYPLSDKSELSKVTHVSSKAKRFIDSQLDLEGQIFVNEISDRLNMTPWKFLDYKFPVELQEEKLT